MGASRGPGANRPGTPADSEILIIRSEHTRAAGPPLPRPGAAAARRPARSTKPPAQKRPEPSSARPLPTTGGVNRPQGLTRGFDVAPIVVGQQHLGTQQAAPAIATPLGSAAPPRAGVTPVSVSLRKIFGSAEALREAFVMNEVLQRPVAMRRGRRPF